MTSPNRLLEGPILKSLLALAIPISLANVLQAAYQLIDAFWVGRLGGAAVAAVSLSTPVMFLTVGLGAGFAIAGSTLVAQYFGAGNHKMVDHVAAQTLVAVVVISLVLGGAGYVAAPGLIHLMGAGPDVFPGALGFMRVSFAGMVFNFFFFMFNAIMRGVGEAKLPVYIVLGTVILNFAFDPLFIFGWGPVPAFGVMGAAVATVGTQSLAALIGLGILLGGRYAIHLGWRHFIPDPDYIRRAFTLGMPASIEQSARALGLTVLTFLITSFGTIAIAAYGVASTVFQVVMIPGLGLAMAMATLVGQNIGAGNMPRAERIARLGSLLGFGILEALGVVAFAFAPQIIAFFVPKDPNVITEGAVVLRTMALSWGFIGLQFGLAAVLRAAGSMVMPMVLTLVSQWVLQFPIAYVLSEHAGMAARGIWWSIPISNVTIALITVAVYAKGDWRKKRLISREEKLAREVSEEIVAEEGVH